MLSVIGLIPVAILSLFAFILAPRLWPRRLVCVSLGGLSGILVYMVPGHLSIWYPLYAGERSASTAAFAFLFIPFYCIPALAVDLLVGWLVSFVPNIRAR